MRGALDSWEVVGSSLLPSQGVDAMKRVWLLLWRISRNDLRMLWFFLHHPARPSWLIPVTVLLGLYALSPLNFALPVIGVLDDFVIVPLALHWLLKLMPQHLQEDYARGASRI